MPVNADRVLSKLPADDSTVDKVQNELHKQVVEELKKNRYGDQPKRQRAKKANWLPPGTAYTVSAIPVEETEPLPGPSGEGRGAGEGEEGEELGVGEELGDGEGLAGAEEQVTLLKTAAMRRMMTPASST